MLASDIVLADAQATPVNHTFVPIGRDSKGVFWFSDHSAPNAIGYWRISVEEKLPVDPSAGSTSGPSRSYRYVLGLHEPVLETVSNSTVSGIAPAPTVAYIPRVFTEYVIPERGTELDRKNLRKMNANLQANSQVVALIEGLRKFN